MTPEHIIEVQVGTDFFSFCTCGWELRTKVSKVLDESIEQHTAITGHRWVTEKEYREYYA